MGDMDWNNFVDLSIDVMFEGSETPSLAAAGMAIEVDPNLDSGALEVVAGASPPMIDKGKNISTDEAPPPAKRPRSDREIIPPPSDSSKKRNLKDVVKKSFSDLFTLELPKALLELNTENSSAFIHSLPTNDDAFALREYSVQQLDKISNQKLVQFLSCHGVLSRKIGSARNEALKKELDDANYNLDLSIERVTSLKQSCSEKDG
ncbi:hypothetical protein ACS0TY_021033 [Phlomoides rotata]